MRNLSLYSSFATKMRKEEKKKRTISVNNNQKITGADIESLFRQLNHRKKKKITSFLDVNRKKKKRAENKQKNQFATERKKKKREVRKRGTA